MTEKAAALFAKMTDTKRDIAQGGIATGGGVVAIKKSYDGGLLTGRTVLYHNTHKKNVKPILNEGLKGSKALDKGTASSLLRDHNKLDPKQLADKVYLATKRSLATNIGAARAFNKFNFDPDVDLKGAAKELFNSRNIKARVNLDKIQRIGNPELEGAKNWRDVKSNYFPSIANWQAKAIFKQLGEQTVVLKGGLGPEHFVRSTHYKPTTLKEVTQFAKKHPGKFTKGVGVSAAGIAAIGYGISKLKNKGK